MMNLKTTHLNCRLKVTNSDGVKIYWPQIYIDCEGWKDIVLAQRGIIISEYFSSGTSIRRQAVLYCYAMKKRIEEQESKHVYEYLEDI